MSSLPPGAPEAPKDQGPADVPETPRWATPAVPPPWAGTGQPAPGQPAPGQPAPGQPAWMQSGQPVWDQPAPATDRRSVFERRKWLPTAAVAAVLAAVVLGGIGLDKVIAAPSVGTVDLGAGATMEAAPGWMKVDTGDSGGVTLQKGNVRVVAIANPYSGTAKEMLASEEDGIRAEAEQIVFGSEHDGTISGHETAMIGFEAIITGTSGNTIEGELICMIVSDDGAEMLAVAPLGGLDSAADDIKAMAKSIEVGR